MQEQTARWGQAEACEKLWLLQRKIEESLDLLDLVVQAAKQLVGRRGLLSWSEDVDV